MDGSGNRVDDHMELSRTKQPSGKVLRVKEGYNPNSSSVGSAIPMFLSFAAATGGVAVLLLNLRSSARELILRRAAADLDAPAGEAAEETKEEDGEG